MSNFVDSSMGMVKAKVDGEIITQTLDKVNAYSKGQKKCSGGWQSMDSMYDFNKSVLSAAYDSKGAIFSGQS